MAADAYTGTGIIRIWIDELVPTGGYDWPPHLGSIPTAYLDNIAPVRSNKWADNPLCRLNAGLRAGKKKRGME